MFITNLYYCAYIRRNIFPSLIYYINRLREGILKSISGSTYHILGE